VDVGIPAVAIFEDNEYFCPYMHTTQDVVGVGLNSPELLETDARVAAAALLTLAGPLVPREGPSFRRGDVAGDGVLNITDVVVLLEYLVLGGVEPACLESADSNDDGTPDIADAIRIVLALFGGQSPLPSPSPGCGPDPTPDSLGCGASPTCP
jgi:hypothetical protein